MQENLNIIEESQEAQNRYLTFFSDNQLFALSIKDIVQITQMQEIIPLPEQSFCVKGIINLRGQIIPIIDIRLRFGKQEAKFTERTCIIIMKVNGKDFGIIVDEVDEVTDIGEEQISDTPQIGLDTSRVDDFLTGIARLKADEGEKERVALLLYVEKILECNELDNISQMIKNSV